MYVIKTVQLHQFAIANIGKTISNNIKYIYNKCLVPTNVIVPRSCNAVMKIENETSKKKNAKDTITISNISKTSYCEIQ